MNGGIDGKWRIESEEVIFGMLRACESSCGSASGWTLTGGVPRDQYPVTSGDL
jgi:hypothetical protein